jgi:spermidine/putrescine transport system ATP-binding protein
MNASDTGKEEIKGDICLDIRNVVKQYPGVTAVDHVSLAIKKGEIFSFLGPSGCGKSTLLRLVAGLESMNQGDVYIGGELVNNLPPYARDCSTVFQTHALFPHMKVFDNIAFGLVERKIPKSEIKQKVAEKIQLVSLEGMEDRYPDQLSGGQRQRVALARSLVLEPMILLLDEPLAALDRKLRKEMQIELKRIQREVGTTFLNVTHDQKEALSVSDRIGVMSEGRFLQIGTPDEIYERPKTTFVASFMGASNIFSGKVVSSKEGKIELETGDDLRIFAPEPDDINQEEIAGFSIHPELINIRPAEAETAPLDPEEYAVFDGTVKEVFYQGDFSEFTVLLKETDMLLTVHMTREGMGFGMKLSEGQEVIASWNFRDNNILAG